MKANWSSPVTYNMYLNVNVVNDKGQKVETLKKYRKDAKGLSIEENGLKGKVTVKVDEKTQYSKTVNNFDFHKIRIRDVVGNAKISGEIELIFEIEESPIPIKPLKQKVTLTDLK